ncbi:hypothetical protein [Hydrogenophaga sp. Root209]|uniref:hypothetical protein n=1 Tax=Hydrogenophaga sp. Root209 TaxID=1736490 RepID=UPI000B1B8E52|nr:hypothetical protein [Hydrogenophaga sp. Root209]
MTAWLRRIFQPRALRIALQKRRLDEATRKAGCSRQQAKVIASHYFGNPLKGRQ